MSYHSTDNQESNKNIQIPQILDCTIRDGGYLNEWQFDPKFVRESYRALSQSGVDIIELGFRSNEKYFDSKKFGLWKFCLEPLLAEVTKGISGAPISLMVDFGKVDLEDIPDKKDSSASMYRVAVHKDKVLPAIELCNNIADKGYIASIQLMGIVNYTDEDFEKVLEPLRTSKITYVYFADSYGSLIPSELKKIRNRLAVTRKKLGFHAHNNMQLGFANTLEAINCGIDIVDATIYGMGRGAGNLPMEILLSYLERYTKSHKFNVLPVLDIIDRYMLDLHDKLKWGYDLSYMLSGMYEVHPYYSKTMVDYREFNIEDILRTLETVKAMNPVGFKKEILDSIIKSGFVGSIYESKDKETSPDEIIEHDLTKFKPVTYKDRHPGKDFLVLANGPTLKEYRGKIENFIKKIDPVIIGANYLGDLFIPDYHTFSNKKRFIDYIDTVNPSSKILVSSSFSEEFIKKYCTRKYEIIQHLPVLSNTFELTDGVISTNCRTVSILGIAVAIVMGANRIFIAGMDGYKQIDHFTKSSPLFYEETTETSDFGILMETHNWNEKLLKAIDTFLKASGKEGLSILTPTSHKAFYKSIDIFIKEQSYA